MNLEIPIWIRILAQISSKEGKSIRKITGSNSPSYSHGFNIIKEMERRKWVIIKKIGRENKTYLTPQGRKISNSCTELLFNSNELTK